MPRGRFEVVSGHSLRKEYRHSTTPHHEFSCSCGHKYGRMTEKRAQEEHNEHKKQFRRW